jgi:2-methylcitrate dehydratase PrpD
MEAAREAMTTPPPGAAAALARFARRMARAPVDPRLSAKVATHALDVLGVCAAAAMQDFAPGVRSVGVGLGGPGEATAIGAVTRLAAPNAALVNGTCAHGLDYDDTHMEAIVHPSCTVVPAVLAVAEEIDASGESIARACAVGLEAGVRIGLAARGRFHDRGFHATPICGAVASALAAGLLYEIDEPALVSGLGLAASMAAGLLEFLSDGTSAKRLHGGWAAHGGILAARLARAGLSGPAGGIDGRFGILPTHLGEPGDPARIHDQLGERWEMLDIALKPYPCCHYLHAFLDAARELRPALLAATGGEPGRIARIECRIPARAVPIVCQPEATKRRPQTPYDAQFSLPFSVAAMLVRGRVTLAEFDPASIAEPPLLALATRVEYRADPDYDLPQRFPGAVRIVLDDGRVLEREELDNRGGPTAPLAAGEVAAKFRANAEPLLGRAGVERVLEILSPKGLPSLRARDLMAPFARPGRES